MASSPRISGNLIEANSAEVGGGIAVVGAHPWIDGNTLSLSSIQDSSWEKSWVMAMAYMS